MKVNELKEFRNDLEYIKKVTETEKIYKDKNLNNKEENKKEEQNLNDEFESIFQESLNKYKK